MINTEVKGTLAKLLATENLNVEHRAIETAYFDIENRIICLPIWKDVPGDVYDMLVGHEVGHALYTSVDYIDALQDIPQDILNVLEDVRIEKLIKRLYPGLSRSFYRAYLHLDKSNFFDIKGKDISKLALIDRINLHYKIGVMVNHTLVNFKPDEIQWVNRAAETETLDDVIQLSKDLVQFLNLQKQEDLQLTNLSGQDTSSGADPSGQSQGQSQGQSDEEGAGGNEDTPVKDPASGTGASGGGMTGSSAPDEMTSETYRSMEEKTKELVDKNARDYLYLDIPKLDLNSTIVPYAKMFQSFDAYLKVNAYSYQEKILIYSEKYRKYKKESIKTVNYLVKEFECKKAASQYSRATTSRTGVLDTARLHHYKFSDDLFKKVTDIPDGKNHGLVFYLDWSGSMAQIMNSTIKQLYDLIWFCRKVSIPFRVYAFSDASSNSYIVPGLPTQSPVGQISVDNSYRLLELFSSKMNSNVLDRMMMAVYVGSAGFGTGTCIHNGDFPLGGTPLVETIITTPQVVQKFLIEENVQKVNVVYLSDGEACHPHYSSHIKSLDIKRSQPIGSRVMILRDPKSRYSKSIDLHSENITQEFVQFISNIVDYNLLGFRICQKSQVRRICGENNESIRNLDKIWEKNRSITITGCGFNELYCIGMTKQEQSYLYWDPNDTTSLDPLAVKDATSKSQLTNAFKKLMNGKMINKTILSKFAAQIA
jgi:hypothetical protein